jgi:FAD/FMN-containing dehydrogenase
MKNIAPLKAERLFTPFLDAIDGTLCLPASADASEIRARTSAHRLRFPLILAPEASLLEHMSGATHAPASSRFGPYCDNVLGMNWRLPDGRVARIGERVVKTTTGYDWLRFLLHSGNRFGEPLDYVLRLRPDCGFSMQAQLEGSPQALRSCVRMLLQSGWMHWWDAVDFVAQERSFWVRVAVHCPAGEAPIFERRLSQIASETSATLRLEKETLPPCDGIPDVVLKTTPDAAIDLAVALQRDALRTIALCYTGVIHVFLEGNMRTTEDIQTLLHPYASALHSVGGDWHSRWLPAPPPSKAEARWIETLERTIHAP